MSPRRAKLKIESSALVIAMLRQRQSEVQATRYLFVKTAKLIYADHPMPYSSTFNHTETRRIFEAAFLVSQKVCQSRYCLVMPTLRWKLQMSLLLHPARLRWKLRYLKAMVLTTVCRKLSWKLLSVCSSTYVGLPKYIGGKVCRARAFKDDATPEKLAVARIESSTILATWLRLRLSLQKYITPTTKHAEKAALAVLSHLT